MIKRNEGQIMRTLSFFMLGKNKPKIGFSFLCFLIVAGSNTVIAEPITYSPDQWPRHWNELMNSSAVQARSNSRYINQAPARSLVWGAAPLIKQKSRRSLRPEYNTNAHMQNYYRQNYIRGKSYSGFPAYDYQTPFTAPMNSYRGAVLAPGLAAPGIPYGTNPYVASSPFNGGVPVMGIFPGSGGGW